MTEDPGAICGTRFVPSKIADQMLRVAPSG